MNHFSPVRMIFHASIPFNPPNYRSPRFEREIFYFSLPIFLKGIFSREFRLWVKVLYFIMVCRIPVLADCCCINAVCLAASFYQSHDSSQPFERKMGKKIRAVMWPLSEGIKEDTQPLWLSAYINYSSFANTRLSSISWVFILSIYLPLEPETPGI